MRNKGGERMKKEMDLEEYVDGIIAIIGLAIIENSIEEDIPLEKNLDFAIFEALSPMLKEKAMEAIEEVIGEQNEPRPRTTKSD